MKKLEFAKYRSLDDLRIIEVDKPVPKENEVLVKIKAASINSWDWELFNAVPFMNRVMFGLFKPKKLKTLGFDVAGQIESVGSNVSTLKIGDEVYGDLSACGWGGFAEYVAVPATALAIKPDNIDFIQAAAVPQAALMSLQGLVDVAHIQPGQDVLINGASGGSGTFAIQIAQTFNTNITAVCSGAKMEFVRALGVDNVIDYTREDFTQNGKTYDIIIDAQAHHSLLDYRRSLKPGGIYVMHGGASSVIIRIMLLGPLLSLFGGRKLRILMHRANKGLEVMNDLMKNGKVVPVIDKVYPLENVRDALEYYGAGNARGKVVINVDPAPGSKPNQQPDQPSFRSPS